MILIVDSGSTKSDWALLNGDDIRLRQELEGISPYFHNEEQMEATFRQIPAEGIRDIHYYGTGCSESDRKEKVYRALKNAFPEARFIEVDSDMMGAARGLCQNEAGIAAILGTGSNSCAYDGKAIVKQHGGLGYVLGDEGSGAVLGKMFMQDFLNHKLPAHLQEELKGEHGLSRDLLLHKVYRQPLPNRYLASFAPLVHQHREDPYIKGLLARHFGLFFEQLAWAFSAHIDWPLHFTGSVAWYFKEELKEAGSVFPFTIGTILRGPTPGLIRFHSEGA